MYDSRPFFRSVVKFQDHLKLPYHKSGEISRYFSQNDRLPFKRLLNIFPGLEIRKLFTSIEPELITELTNRARNLDPDYMAPCFLAYFTIDCPAEKYSNEFLKILKMHTNVELAYVETGRAVPPSIDTAELSIDMHQGYLRPAPEGIDAIYAWNFEGSDGKGNLKFIDIEQGWNLDPENFSVGTFPNSGINYQVFKDHGTAVLGVILMRENLAGGRGIASKANGYVISQWRPDGFMNTPDAIMAAVSQLKYGDVILLEAQISDSPESDKLWPVEIQNAIFDVIRLAAALGITVVEAAGNGKNSFCNGNDLDDYIDSYGRKSLDPSSSDFRDSGAILVAAATDTLPHNRLRYSNFGNRIDCYAWGERVTASGSYPANSDMAINSYRKKINGTSSAAAIVAGAAIVMQSFTEANYQVRLNPGQMRQTLSSDLLCTPSANGRFVDKIGVMPDLRKIIDHISNVRSGLKP
jgi:Subtilase family